MSQVTPLRYDRIPAGVGGTKPTYGESSYLTADDGFNIVHMPAGWMIRRFCAATGLWNQVIATGATDTAFARRKDAVAALKQVLEAIDE